MTLDSTGVGMTLDGTGGMTLDSTGVSELPFMLAVCVTE